MLIFSSTGSSPGLFVRQLVQCWFKQLTSWQIDMSILYSMYILYICNFDYMLLLYIYILRYDTYVRLHDLQMIDFHCSLDVSQVNLVGLRAWRSLNWKDLTVLACTPLPGTPWFQSIPKTSETNYYPNNSIYYPSGWDNPSHIYYILSQLFNHPNPSLYKYRFIVSLGSIIPWSGNGNSPKCSTSLAKVKVT